MSKAVDKKSKDDSGTERRRNKKRPVRITKRHIRIMQLPPQVKAELDNRISMNESITQLGRWLQQECKQCLDITEDSVVVTLARYKNSMPMFDSKFTIKGGVGSVYEEKKIDELDELHKLIRIQNERIGMHMTLERQFRRPMKNASADIDLAARLCVRAHDVKMDLGMGGGRDLGTVGIRPELQMRVREKYGPEIEALAMDEGVTAKVFPIFQELKARAKLKESGGDS